MYELLEMILTLFFSADVYKNIENVEEEQNVINETIELRKRRRTGEKRSIDEAPEKNEEEGGEWEKQF